MNLEKVKIKRIIGPTPSGAAVLLGNEKKTFVVFVGFYEAAAILREINHEIPARPLTHELIQNVFLGFGVEVKHVNSKEDAATYQTLAKDQLGTELAAQQAHKAKVRAKIAALMGVAATAKAEAAAKEATPAKPKGKAKLSNTIPAKPKRKKAKGAATAAG